MLRLNQDRSFTLMKPRLPTCCEDVPKSFPVPKIHLAHEDKLVDFTVWKEKNKEALKHILYHVYEFIMTMNTGDYILTINPDLFEELMVKKIYEQSDNRFEAFMSLS